MCTWINLLNYLQQCINRARKSLWLTFLCDLFAHTIRIRSIGKTHGIYIYISVE